jgi:nucleoside-diphosphate-sugar epimerase
MVIVTGAAGFLGHFVLSELLSRKLKVIAISRSAHLVDQETHSSAQWIQADLSKDDAFAAVPMSTDGVVHLASSLSTDPRRVLKEDIPAMWRALSLWDQGPFVLLSSTDVYGQIQRIPTEETAPLTPAHWYGFGKQICELLLRMAAKTSNRSDYLILRSPYILGAHDRFPMSLFGRLIVQAKSHVDFVLPEHWQDRDSELGHSWVSAKELAGWIVSALCAGIYGTYNATSGFVTWKELIELILRLAKSNAKISYSESGGSPFSLCEEQRHFSNSKLIKAFSIDHFTTLEEALSQLIERVPAHAPAEPHQQV